jgi:hypothetical protein
MNGYATQVQYMSACCRRESDMKNRSRCFEILVVPDLPFLQVGASSVGRRSMGLLCWNKALYCKVATSIEVFDPQASTKDNVRLKSPTKMRVGLARRPESETFNQKDNLLVKGP